MHSVSMYFSDTFDQDVMEIQGWAVALLPGANRTFSLASWLCCLRF